MYLSPSLGFSGKLGKKGRTKYDFSVFGNIPFKDEFKSGSTVIDLTGNNARPLFGAGLKVRF